MDKTDRNKVQKRESSTDDSMFDVSSLLLLFLISQNEMVLKIMEKYLDHKERVKLANVCWQMCKFLGSNDIIALVLNKSNTTVRAVASSRLPTMCTLCLACCSSKASLATSAW